MSSLFRPAESCFHGLNRFKTITSSLPSQKTCSRILNQSQTSQKQRRINTEIQVRARNDKHQNNLTGSSPATCPTPETQRVGVDGADTHLRCRPGNVGCVQLTSATDSHGCPGLIYPFICFGETLQKKTLLVKKESDSL